jgi:septum site-determining protein MinC
MKVSGGYSMEYDFISFKGTQDGIYIYIKEGDFQHIKEELDMKLSKSGSFFKGGQIISFKGMELSDEEESQLRSIIKNKYNIRFLDKDIGEEEKKGYFDGIEEGMTAFIRTTVRSGQLIEYDGNVVVLGDVNPGGMIEARGNIVVLGTLRGIAHAGCDGNREAIVSAYNLQPTQLRIADLISRSPDDEIIQSSKWPEIAKIEGEEVVIETYLPKNNL